MQKNRNFKLVIIQSSASTYIIGFGLSLALTLAAYLTVQIHLRSGHLVLSDNNVLLIMACLAISQLFVQLVFFLHLNRENKPRLNSLIMLFASLVVVIIVGGSVWIMNNLNYHGMSAVQTNNFILKDEGVKN